MALWTFVNEYKGGTYIAQYSSPRIYPAIEKYIEVELPKVFTLAKAKPDAVEVDLSYLNNSKIEGVESVYCLAFFDTKSTLKKSQNMLINIIKTARE